MTLAKKAAILQQTSDKKCHHHDGLIADSGTTKYGVFDDALATPLLSGNAGLWTGVYLAGQCFRYGATKSEQARQNVLRAFDAMEMLFKVTGVRGYPARDFVHAPSAPPDWLPSRVYPGYWWSGDTSSDELVGHMFAYPLVLDIVAGSDHALASRAIALMVNMTSHIQNHNWYLIGETGNHTRWGVWNPAQINGEEDWEDSRGTNSLEILAWLTTSHRVRDSASVILVLTMNSVS
jgi:hypothetical protein